MCAFTRLLMITNGCEIFNHNPLTLQTGTAVLMLPRNRFDETCPHEFNDRAVSKHCSLTNFLSKFGALSGKSVPRAGLWEQSRIQLKDHTFATSKALNWHWKVSSVIRFESGRTDARKSSRLEAGRRRACRGWLWKTLISICMARPT